MSKNECISDHSSISQSCHLLILGTDFIIDFPLVILLIGIVFHVFNFTFVPPSLMIILVNSRIRLVNKRIVIRVEHRLGSIICTHFLSPSEDNPLQPLSWVGLAGHGLTDYTTKYKMTIN
jgi:hypothetical protein